MTDYIPVKHWVWLFIHALIYFTSVDEMNHEGINT